MKLSRFRAGASLTVLLGGMVVVTTIAGDANAQESSLLAAKERTRQAPMSPDAALVYGRALRRAGHESEALVELRRAHVFARGETAVTVDWEIARTHIAKRDFNAAMATCGGIKKLPGGPPASHACAAEAHLLWRRGTEALAELAELAKINGANAEVIVAAKLVEGRARELDSKTTEAEAAYRESIRLAPNRAEGHMRLGTMLQRLGQDGVPSLQRAVELDAHDPIAQFELARALSRDPKRRAESIASLECATAEQPGFADALHLLAESYLAADRLADAKRAATQALEVAPGDVRAHIVSGRVALANDKPDEAIAAGEAALKILPNEGKAKLLIADAYTKKGEIDLALEAFQKASGLDPLNPVPLVNATYACLAAKRLTSAKAFGQRAVLDFPNHVPAWVAQGDALAADGNPKAARTAYEAAKKAWNAAAPSARGDVDLAAIDAKLSRLK